MICSPLNRPYYGYAEHIKSGRNGGLPYIGPKVLVTAWCMHAASLPACGFDIISPLGERYMQEMLHNLFGGYRNAQGHKKKRERERSLTAPDFDSAGKSSLEKVQAILWLGRSR